ncbi:MAG: methylated-DNA--[protein]-cysteine S-methyltransferase [Gammaproteobacteria bacterium]|nr:methylated-DNA--[protein]-cysteine S-methyltransferase [Gammaproteobacteria bacterium]
MQWCQIESPVGPLLLAADAEGLRVVHFQGGTAPRPVPAGWVSDARPFARVRAQLGEYFAGRRQRFELKLAPAGTPFQLAVWRALCEIPYGETWSYGELARHVGVAGGARAVGLANGANPLPIIVPCHRVIGADGSLTGFGGGLAIKRSLLSLEGAARTPDLFDAPRPARSGDPGADAPRPPHPIHIPT